MPGRSDKPNDLDWVMEQHSFASGLYEASRRMSEEVEALFKSELSIPSDTGDTKTPGGPRVARPAKARAILEKFLTLIASVRAISQLQVVPRSTGEQEQKVCSTIERWLEGYVRQYQKETKKRVWRDAIYWSLLRGRSYLEVRYNPQYLHTDYLPIRTVVSDPNAISPVWGETGIGWYTKETERYVWELKAEFALKGGRKKKWHPPDLSKYDDNDLIPCVEYWDKEYCAYVVAEQLVWNNEHGYGFVPIAEARMMDTPLAAMEWAAQSVLYPIMDSVKMQYVLANKLAAGVDLFFWPRVLLKTASGWTLVDSAIPGEIQNAPLDATPLIINPTPNAPLLQQMMAWFKGDEALAAIPDIAWGMEPNSLESGFAISQVLAQVEDKASDKTSATEAQQGWHFGHVLQLAERYAAKMDGAKMTVPVSDDDGYGGRKKNRPTLLSLSADDISGHYDVEVTITPRIPQNEMQKSQLAQAYRAPGVDGKPLLDDETIVTDVLKMPHPDTIKRRINGQLLPSQNEEVARIVKLAAEKEWMEDNKELVKLAAKREEELLNPDDEEMVPASKVKELAMLMAKDMHASMMGEPGLAEMMQQAQMAARQGPLNQLPATVQPPGMNAPPAPGVPIAGSSPITPPGGSAPAGPPPGAMPSQMMMTPGEVLPEPATVQAKQQRRLRPQNKRKR